MRQITVTKTTEVPNGIYCENYRDNNSEKCKHITSETSNIGLDSALGSRGRTTFMCAFFNFSYLQLIASEGLKKCDGCLKLSGDEQ